MQEISKYIPFRSFLQGKYVEIQFSRGGEPIGGVISNFLLEKVSQTITLFSRPVVSNTIALISLQKESESKGLIPQDTYA